MGKISRDVLQRHWVHSQEEDTDTEQVFRPTGFRFPPARGREAFDLRPGGRLLEYGIGPTDRRQIVEGRWQLEDDDRLEFLPSAASSPHRVLRVVSADAERLVIAKELEG